MMSFGELATSVEATVITHATPRALAPILESNPTPGGCLLVFHRDADLEVHTRTFDGDLTIYMVCASALACASPVWRSMVYSDAAPVHEARDASNQNQIQAIELDGDPEAIGLLFRIVHYDFGHVPREPTLNQLFELGKSACKYGCEHILYPWASQWTSRLINFVAESDCYSECHKAVYVAWAFGELKLFREAIDALIVSAKIDHNGKVVNVSGLLLESMVMPPGLLDVVTETRSATITEILDVVKTPIRVLSSGKQSQPSPYCKIGKDSQACEVMMLGSAIPALAKAGLFPVPEPENFAGSIESLKSQLDEVKTIPYVGREWVPHMSHENCDLGFREAVMACLKRMIVPLDAFIMGWMSNQAETCGIEATSELEEWRQRSGESSIRGLCKPSRGNGQVNGDCGSVGASSTKGESTEGESRNMTA